jgi:hypothetical protein
MGSLCILAASGILSTPSKNALPRPQSHDCPPLQPSIAAARCPLFLVMSDVEMDGRTRVPFCLPEQRADTYRYKNRPSARCPLAGVRGSACETPPPRHHLAYLADVYRLLPITETRSDKLSFSLVDHSPVPLHLVTQRIGRRRRRDQAVVTRRGS